MTRRIAAVLSADAKGYSRLMRGAAGELGVRYVVSGAVQREGSRLRVGVTGSTAAPTMSLDSTTAWSRPPWRRLRHTFARRRFAARYGP